MSNIEDNVELLIHQLRNMVKKKKEEENNAFKNDLIIQLEKQVDTIIKRNSSEFTTTYNVGSINYLFKLLLLIIKQQSKDIQLLKQKIN